MEDSNWHLDHLFEREESKILREVPPLIDMMIMKWEMKKAKYGKGERM